MRNIKIDKIVFNIVNTNCKDRGQRTTTDRDKLTDVDKDERTNRFPAFRIEGDKQNNNNNEDTEKVKRLQKRSQISDSYKKKNLKFIFI